MNLGRKQLFLILVLSSLLGAIAAIGGYKFLATDQVVVIQTEPNPYVKYSNLLLDSNFTVPKGLNFVSAAAVATAGVVHIRSTYSNAAPGEDYLPYDHFFKDFYKKEEEESKYHKKKNRAPGGKSAGSGVIISPDGYIITNHHVIEGAETIEVVLFNNKKYVAEIVGVDLTTDLSVLKVEAENLPYLRFGDSDEAQIGEWVLAVGNPFDLTSTVTAGIISAKARNINILQNPDGLQIESFIQTDAAVNPGNSGGALVNLKGEIIGINTAIATPTGSYAGYSFAVPSGIVKKVAEDIIRFGIVQRALLGVRITDVDANLAREKELNACQGVFVLEVNPNSAASEAGLKKGDVIVKIDQNNVTSVAELQEHVACNRPGDQIQITFHRSGKMLQTNAILRNMNGKTNLIDAIAEFEVEGALFKVLDPVELRKLGLTNGVQIADLKPGKWLNVGIKEGFIITHIDRKLIRDLKELKKALYDRNKGLLVEGVYPNGESAFYGLGW